MSKTDSKKIVVDTTNPFNKGVSYADFLKNVKGNTTVDTLLDKHNISDKLKDFVKREIKNIKK